ncbi:transporter RND family [Butyrivibrio proteoclasticus B316]|uniref:Transporter RND family n=1 Tax=Butyrivibrio proteoclasticus (strain ATCC 51982 / DSM 14932 / B316) TaxID=515622 RepID=E0RY01_BUTPB|nr:efflux RND transporter periplasmic adaptor subunit [Butyrivibrio proteoclasticus]ADL34956.1 transporter RND family [Butyrivibrio proteoclasticus B316]
MAQDKELETKVKEETTASDVTVKNTEDNKPEAQKDENTLVYEEYEQHEVAAKPKRKFKKRYVVIGVALLLVAFIVFNSINSAKKAVVMVETKEASLGTIENILSISGTVQSAESKTYFSDVTAPLSEINVKVGDKVAAGDTLYTYDEAALDLSKQTAELAIKQAKGSYNSYWSGTAAADRKYAEGLTPQQINDRLDAITAEIDALNNKITEKTSRMNQTLTDLQKVQADINQNGIADSSENLFENGNTEYIYRTESGNKTDGAYNNPSESDRQMSLAVSQSMLDVQYALSNDPEIQGWKRQITALQEEQSHLQTGKAAQVNPGTATSAKAQLDSTTLTQEDAISKIDAAKEGVKSDFNGVVTAVSVVEGATVAAGAQTVTLANLDDVEVSVQISKSDLPKIAIGQQVDITINSKPYTGEISKISGTATKNNNGVAVVDTTIKVTNPDSDIILGVEANNKIHAQKAENTLVLPYEYVQTDSEGDYVYVVENGIVVRKNVTIGIASSTEAQIVDGLNAGDKIVTGNYENLSDGMAVVEMEG